MIRISAPFSYSLIRAAALTSAIVTAIAPQFAQATEKCEFLLTQEQSRARGVRLKKLLKDKLFAALEDELQSKQHRIESGTYSDELLRQDIHAAFDSDPSLEPLLGEWIRAYPKSFVARVARARHYVDSGYTKRGTAFSDKTSQEQFKAMQQQFEKAVSDLNDALLLSKTPTLVYAERLFIARAIEGDGVVVNLVDEGYRNFPKSLAIKAVAASALNPKWGGSFEELDKLAASARAAKMDKDAARIVRYRVEMEKANYFDVATKQYARAAEHYRMAGGICVSSEPWQHAIRVTYEIEDWSGLITAANRLLEQQPTDSGALQRRGWAYEKLGHMREAVKDYETAAASGSAWAQNKFGWILWQGKDVPRDLPRAKRLFEQAAEQGNTYAKANLAGISAELENK